MTRLPEQPGGRLARGVCRLMLECGAAPLTEFVPAPGLRVDVIALHPDGAVSIVECKSSSADFRADAKWQGYLDWCDAFYFAVDADFPQALLPEAEGLILADAYGAEVLRRPLPRRLPPARRRALTLRLAMKAAQRLRGVLDPQTLLSGSAMVS